MNKEIEHWINKIHQGDVFELLRQMPDECVDMVMTSPPYWGLRDYGVDGQIGLEKHPQEYINKMVSLMREIRRVLKKTGSVYLNLGDTYFAKMASRPFSNKTETPHPDGKWLQSKQLMGMPWRVAIACQNDGWILRNAIVWAKPNPMPSSVKDRLNNTYEHIFHFVQSRKYFYDLDAIREPHKVNTIERAKYGGNIQQKEFTENGMKKISRNGIPNPLGKNPGDVWQITTQPFPEAHFAVYPEKICEKPILSSCPKGGILLDPFMGSGTTALVAKKL